MRELNYTGALLGIFCGAIYGGALGSAFDQTKIGVLVGIAAWWIDRFYLGLKKLFI